MKSSRRSWLSLRLLVAALPLLSLSATAASLLWDADGVSGAPTGGTGTWNTTTTLWDDAGTMVTWNNGTPDSATFGSTAGTVTLGESITANTVSFDTAGYTLLGGGMGGPALTANGITLNANTTFGNSTTTGNPVVRLAGDLTGTGTLTSQAAWLASDSATPRTLSTPLLIGAGDGNRAIRLGDTVNTGTLTFTGTVITNGVGRGVEVMAGSSAIFQNGVSGGTNSITKGGAGTLVLGGSSTFTGNLAINSGVLEMAVNGRLYNAGYNNTAVITVSGGSTWRIPNYSYSGMGQLADYRQRRVLDNGTIEVTADTHSSGQDFTVNAAGGTFRYTPTGQTLTLEGNSNTNIQFNGPLSFDTVGNISVTGASASLEGTGSLIKTGGGTLTLGNAGNSFSGNLTVNTGLLRASVSTGSATNSSLGAKNGSRTVTVNAPGTMEWTSNNILGGGNMSAANLPSIALNGGTLTTTRFNVLGNLSLAGASLVNANATDPVNYDGFQFIGTVTATGTTPSTISTSTGRSNHLRGGTATPVEVTDAAGLLTISTVLRDGSGDYPGTGSITKTGPGTLALSAANLYTGATTVSTGTLALTGSGTVAGNLTAQPGAVLDLTGLAAAWSPASGRTLSAGRTASPATDITGDLSLEATRTLQIGGPATAATLSQTGDIQLAGGTVQFDLGQTPATSDTIALDGSLEIGSLSSTTFNFALLGLTIDAGIYPLISTTGGITGDVADILTTGLPSGPGGRQTFTLSTTTIPNTLTLDVAGAGAVLVWNNAANTGAWNTTDLNWDNNGSNDKFVNADVVRFEDTANASETLTLAEFLEPASVTAANTTATTFILEGSGAITGSTGLAVNGGGTLVVRNANTFQGATIISGGSRVELENRFAFLDNGTVSIENGTLDIGATADVFLGTINLGTGGQITGSNGTLDPLSINAAGGTIDADLVGGSLTISSAADVSLSSSSNRGGASTTIAGGGTLRLRDGAAFTGNISHAGVIVGDGNTGTASLTGTLSGGGALRMETGTLTLGGSQAYSGNTTLNGGLLDLATADARLYSNTYHGGPVLSINSGATLRASRINYSAANHLGQLAHNSPNNVINGGILDLVGAADTSGRGWTIGTNGGTIRSAAGSTQTWSPSDEAWTQIDLNNNAATLTFDVGGTFTLRSTIMDYTGTPGLAGGISTSNGGIVKTGPGLLDLGPINLVAAANLHRYTGSTVVSQGTLQLNSNIGSSPVSVATGATLAIGGSQPSFSCGGLTLVSGATLSGQINSDSASVNALAVAGNIDLGGATLNLSDLGTTQLPNNTKLTLLAYTGALSGTFNGLTEGASVVVGSNTFTIAYQDAGAVTLTATVDGNDYDDWSGPSGFNLVQGPTGDDDGDGLSNFDEYAFGLNPTDPASVSPVTAPDKMEGAFTYTRRKPSLTGLTYSYHSSTTLTGIWPAFTPPAPDVSNNGDPVETITVTIPPLLLAEPELFLRVHATQP
jgi:autotransporter-associated beta strand protein